jgi:hypothetical protein
MVVVPVPAVILSGVVAGKDDRERPGPVVRFWKIEKLPSREFAERISGRPSLFTSAIFTAPCPNPFDTTKGALIAIVDELVFL